MHWGTTARETVRPALHSSEGPEHFEGRLECSSRASPTSASEELPRMGEAEATVSTQVGLAVTNCSLPEGLLEINWDRQNFSLRRSFYSFYIKNKKKLLESHL